MSKSGTHRFHHRFLSRYQPEKLAVLERNLEEQVRSELLYLLSAAVADVAVARLL
jgi:hypothetical protein